MKKTTLFVLAVLAVLALATATLPSFGLNAIAPAIAPQPSTYTVQDGDTLWGLSGIKLQDPLQWGQILGANPFLSQPGRVRVTEKDGKTIVLIHRGEKLEIPDGLGVTPEVVPFSALKPASPAQTAPAQHSMSPYFWILLPLFWVFLGIGVFVLYSTLRRVFRNPATSGEPIIQGGIQSGDTDGVERRFQRIADGRYVTANPLADLTAVARPIRIGPIEEGTLSGFGRVAYQQSTETRHLHNEPAYRSRFRFPDGHEEELFFLQACANDVTFSGMRYLGFTFTPGRAIVATPPPRPNTPPRPISVPAVAHEAVAGLTILVGDEQVIVPVGHSVRVGERGEIIITPPTAKRSRSTSTKPSQQAAASGQ